MDDYFFFNYVFRGFFLDIGRDRNVFVFFLKEWIVLLYENNLDFFYEWLLIVNFFVSIEIRLI